MNDQVKLSSNMSSKFLGLYFLIPPFTLQFSSELMLLWCSEQLTQFLEAHLMGEYTSEVSSYDNMIMHHGAMEMDQPGSDSLFSFKLFKLSHHSHDREIPCKPRKAIQFIK